METMGVVQRVRIADLPVDTTWPKHEIIDGSLLVTPAPGRRHQGVVSDAHLALRLAAPDGVVVYPGANVRRVGPDGEADLLIPDVVVVRAPEPGTTADVDPVYLAPEEVLVAVEVVSPSTRTTDTVTKRAAYAEWAIGAYLVVDPAQGSLTWYGDTSGAAWAVAALEGLLDA